MQVFGQLDKLVSQLGYSSGHLTAPSQSYLINMTRLVIASLSSTIFCPILTKRHLFYLPLVFDLVLIHFYLLSVMMRMLTSCRNVERGGEVVEAGDARDARQ